MCYLLLTLSPSHSHVSLTPIKGFRMVAGNPALRSKTGTSPGICHRCNGAAEVNGNGGAPCDAGDTSTFPTKMCTGGIRATIIFPTCWNGKNLDSPDHQSHMAYAPGGAILAGAACPSTHPVRVPQASLSRPPYTIPDTPVSTSSI